MSINEFSTDIQQTLIWWAQQSIMEPNPNTSSSKPNRPPNSSWRPHLYHHYQPSAMFPPQNPNLNFNLNEEDDEEQDHEQQQQPHDEAQREHEQEGLVLDKEPMFEKPLTPSDVGKLNRLVIPKQHAEKYFPLSGASVDKGLLLSFEDESGKYWRFRYSYWNSSQSYVLTKGWSRYVKEKQLDAGDAVLFERHRTDSDRLFIGWRRRGEMSGSSSASNSGVMVQGSGGGASRRGLYTSSSSSSGPNYHLSSCNTQHGLGAPNVPFQSDCLHAAVTAAQNQTAQLGNSRRLRLFGVNLECQMLDEAEPSTSGGSSLSSLQGPVLHQQLYSHQSDYSTHSQMDSTFSSRDVNQMRNRRG